MQKAIDVSNYSGRFSAETVACWRAQGFDHIICGTQRPSITRSQLEAATEGGLSADAYVYLYWAYDIESQVKEALQTIDGLPIERLWLDCEDAPAGRSPEQIVAMIEAAVAACGDFPHGIYTGRWWWQPATSDSPAFSHLPLWHAEYTSGPDALPDFDAFRPYGGWTRPSMWQFQGTTQLCGIGVDLNLRQVADTATTPPAEQPPAEDATEAPAGALLAELATLQAERRFLRSLLDGHYAFRPANDGLIELQRQDDGVLRPFDPPLLLRVD